AAVPASTFEIWLEPVRAIGARGTTLYLAAPDGISAWVERRYSALLREALAGAGSELSEIAFDGGGGEERREPGSAPTVDLNPNYTFERFVIGEGNRVVHAAAP